MQWSIPNVMRWNYAYQYFNENTGRVVYAQNLDDPTLDRSYDYDHVGRPVHFTSGSNARHHTGQGGTPLNDGPYSHGYSFDVWGNRTSMEGWGGIGRNESVSYTNNRRNGFSYDAAGNLINDLGQIFTYDATGQQATAGYSGYLLAQTYDGDRLRVKKVENGTTTYYLRSTVLGGQIVAELNGAGAFTRGFVYLGGQLLAVQQNNQVSWVHQDPVAKSKRVTDGAGNIVSTIELDPWGGDTARSSNEAFQPRRFTTYDRDGNASDEAMHRRYNRWHARFDQPDPYGGSYDMTNPQSFNRYSYVQNDPVNFVDPSGLDDEFTCQVGDPNCVVGSVTINISGGERGVGVGGTSSGPMEIETSGNGPTGAEIVPQNPAQPSPTPDPCRNVNAAFPLEPGQGYYRYSATQGSNLAADNGLLNYAQAGVVSVLINFASDWNTFHPDHPIGIGDLGERGGGGNFNRHPGSGHANGRIIDIRPMTITGGSGDAARTNITDPNYSRDLTNDLVQGLMSTMVVERILFNDTQINNVTSSPGHDNHLHVVFRSGAGCN